MTCLLGVLKCPDTSYKGKNSRKICQYIYQNNTLSFCFIHWFIISKCFILVRVEVDSVSGTLGVRKERTQSIAGTLYTYIKTLENLAVPGAGKKPEHMEGAQAKVELAQLYTDSSLNLGSYWGPWSCEVLILPTLSLCCPKLLASWRKS